MEQEKGSLNEKKEKPIDNSRAVDINGEEMTVAPKSHIKLSLEKQRGIQQSPC